MARLFVLASSQYLENANAVVTATPLTIACWFQSNSATLSQDCVSLANNATANDYFRLNLGGNAAGDPVRAVTQEGAFAAQIAATTTGYTVNTWHHAAAVFATSTDRRAYIDGGSKGTNTGSSIPTGLNTTAIGRQSSVTPTSYMSGLIAEVAIWNVALTDEEVAQLGVLRLAPPFVRRQNLVFYPPILGLNSPELDLSGFNYHLTVNGATIAEHPPGIVTFPARQPFPLPVR